MKRILLFGAGKSATVLIRYLVQTIAAENWCLTVADANLNLAAEKIKKAPNALAASFDIADDNLRQNHIAGADIVISLLPPALHILVANDCIRYKKNLLTASYVDGEMQKLQPQIEAARLLFLCEMGLDPGLDHMSAKQLIDGIQKSGGDITSFLSHCGGLVAPESDDNPWHYKISWNPQNVVRAGKGGAVFKWHGAEKRLEYGALFAEDRLTDITGLGPYGWYPNRDSLSYIPLYGLQNCATFVRTTLRHPDFIKGWKSLIDWQLTDETTSYRTAGKTVKDLFGQHLQKQGVHANSETRAQPQITYLGLADNDTKLSADVCTAADLLQAAPEEKLALKAGDKDLVVMQHEVEFLLSGHLYKKKSTLIVKGENSQQTAMAKTVGLPLGIAATLMLKGRITAVGLRIPVAAEIYEPVLAELGKHDIRFVETSETLR